MRVLLFGADGQVGRALRAAAPAFGGVALVPDRAEADLTRPDRCAALVREAAADVVINAAAYTAVDRAETEEALATLINGAAPGAMAEAAARRGAPFLHVSTDYVFDGAGDEPWPETAPTAPLGAYGRSKLAGERAVAAAGGAWTVLRTAWVFSPDGANFVKTMLRLGRERPRLTVVDDQRGGPTPADSIAAALLTVARATLEGRPAPGLLHFCGAPTVTWRGFAEEIFRQADLLVRPEVAPIATADWPTPARRPANSALDCRRAFALYGLAQPDWREGLARTLRILKETSA